MSIYNSAVFENSKVKEIMGNGLPTSSNPYQRLLVDDHSATTNIGTYGLFPGGGLPLGGGFPEYGIKRANVGPLGPAPFSQGMRGVHQILPKSSDGMFGSQIDSFHSPDMAGAAPATGVGSSSPAITTPTSPATPSPVSPTIRWCWCDALPWIELKLLLQHRYLNSYSIVTLGGQTESKTEAAPSSHATAAVCEDANEQTESRCRIQSFTSSTSKSSDTFTSNSLTCISRV